MLERDLFYIEDHRLRDAKIHDAILDDGDDAAAQRISDSVAREIGLTDAEIAALHAPPAAKASTKRFLHRFDEDEPRDDQGQWTDGGGGDGGSGDGESPAGLVSTSPESFIAARDKTTRPQFLSPLKPDDLSDHTLLVTKDKTAGVAIDPKGDLQNLFNNGGPKGIAADLVGEAIGKGARTLDCYDGHLPGYYRQFGFEETGRIKFNPEFAHGWDIEKHGRPDVVFMAWKGYLNDDAKAAIERAKSSKDNWIVNEPSKHYADDYDAAKAESRLAAGGKADRRLSGKEQGPSADRAGNQSGARSGAGHRRPLAKFSEDEPRDDQGRWTDGGGSDSAPVAGYAPGVKTPQDGKIEHAKAVKNDFIAKSPVKTIDDVKRLAAEGQKALGDVGRQIGTKLGLTFKDPGPKTKSESGVKRVQDKAVERGGNLASVTDTARATFLVDKPEQTDQLIAELGKHFEVAAEPFKMTAENYADRSANVRLPNGIIAEIQMMHPKMADAKSPDGGGGHDLYKVSRESAPTGVKPDPAKYADAVAKQRELYGKALDAMPADWRKVAYELAKALFGRLGKFGKAR